MKTFFQYLRGLLEHPVKMALSALAIAFASLLAQGTLMDLWNLKTQKLRLEQRFQQTLKYNTALESKIGQAQSSDKFIGRQAREKLDLVKNDELVFIFENDNTETPSAKR